LRRRADPHRPRVGPLCLGRADNPLDVARFGDRFDAQRVLAGSKDANGCIGYITKYLTKHAADCHQAETGD
jgi:hypothetical protein